MKAAIGFGPVIETRLRSGPFEAEIRLVNGRTFIDRIERIRAEPQGPEGLSRPLEIDCHREGWLAVWLIDTLIVGPVELTA